MSQPPSGLRGARGPTAAPRVRRGPRNALLLKLSSCLLDAGAPPRPPTLAGTKIASGGSSQLSQSIRGPRPGQRFCAPWLPRVRGAASAPEPPEEGRAGRSEPFLCPACGFSARPPARPGPPPGLKPPAQPGVLAVGPEQQGGALGRLGGQGQGVTHRVRGAEQGVWFRGPGGEQGHSESLREPPGGTRGGPGGQVGRSAAVRASEARRRGGRRRPGALSLTCWDTCLPVGSGSIPAGGLGTGGWGPSGRGHSALSHLRSTAPPALPHPRCCYGNTGRGPQTAHNRAAPDSGSPRGGRTAHVGEKRHPSRAWAQGCKHRWLVPLPTQGPPGCGRSAREGPHHWQARPRATGHTGVPVSFR